MPRSILLLIVVMIAGCGSAATHQTLGNVDTQVAVATSPASNRKGIFEATLKLIVTDLTKLEQNLPKLVKEHEGYLAQVSIDRTHGHYITGRWVARVPVKRYEAFLAVIAKQGIPDTFDQKSQDVTEEYVDLETRIANEKRLEERILELLKRREGEIKEVIAVEHELARVRAEIEKMTGRVRFLAEHTEFTTVTIDAVEREAYVAAPPQTFSSRVTQSWRESLSSLRQGAEDVFVALVYLFPWLTSLAVFILPAVWVLRRNLWRSRLRHKAVSVQE